MGRTVRRRSLLPDDEGTVFLEFLVSFVPVWIFSLCVFQLALIARANLVVKHAADAAARSAAVVLPDDPAEYGGEPQMSVARHAGNPAGLIAALESAASIMKSPTARSVSRAFSARALANVGRSRLNTIRLAAHVPLMPLAPGEIRSRRSPNLENAIGGKRSLLSSLRIQPFAVAVTFPNESEGFIVGPEVTVRVTYAYPCSVPVARRILCGDFGELASTGDWRQSFLNIAQRFALGAFRELQHESTALIHQAPYAYRPRGA